jgi:hypothetical protein
MVGIRAPAPGAPAGRAGRDGRGRSTGAGPPSMAEIAAKVADRAPSDTSSRPRPSCRRLRGPQRTLTPAATKEQPPLARSKNLRPPPPFATHLFPPPIGLRRAGQHTSSCRFTHAVGNSGVVSGVNFTDRAALRRGGASCRREGSRSCARGSAGPGSGTSRSRPRRGPA